MSSLINKCIQSSLLLGCLLVTSAHAKFCAPAEQPITIKQQDELFMAEMFAADYVFKGRLFTFYDEKCDGEICQFQGLVFKVLQQVENKLPLYFETTWTENCDKPWLYSSQWRTDKDEMLFKVNSEYVVLANDTPKGVVVIGAKGGITIKNIIMRYELERIGRED